MYCCVVMLYCHYQLFSLRLGTPLYANKISVQKQQKKLSTNVYIQWPYAFTVSVGKECIVTSIKTVEKFQGPIEITNNYSGIIFTISVKFLYFQLWTEFTYCLLFYFTTLICLYWSKLLTLWLCFLFLQFSIVHI